MPSFSKASQNIRVRTKVRTIGNESADSTQGDKSLSKSKNKILSAQINGVWGMELTLIMQYYGEIFSPLFPAFSEY